MLKKILIVISLVLLLLMAALLYPLVPDTPADAGQAASKLDPTVAEQIAQFADSADTIDAVVVADSDELLFEHGTTSAIINTHSVRKSIMSVMFGAAALEGRVDVQMTLAELDIDDAKMPLTDLERTATVADLLTARSGIYIEAAGETAEMKARRPQRGQYQPGQHYYYNNWDFNTLGAILARATGEPLEDHYHRLAERLEFEDYQRGQLYFSEASGSEHDQYIIFLSARDLLKIGQMMLRGGRTPDGSQLLSPEWIAESTSSYSEITDVAHMDGYGYLWWLDSAAGTYWASGWGGQFMLVDPGNDLIIVTRNHTGRRLGSVLWLSVLGNSTQGRMGEVARIHEMILAARDP